LALPVRLRVDRWNRFFIKPGSAAMSSGAIAYMHELRG